MSNGDAIHPALQETGAAQWYGAILKLVYCMGKNTQAFLDPGRADFSDRRQCESTVALGSAAFWSLRFTKDDIRWNAVPRFQSVDQPSDILLTVRFFLIIDQFFTEIEALALHATDLMTAVLA